MSLLAATGLFRPYLNPSTKRGLNEAEWIPFRPNVDQRILSLHAFSAKMITEGARSTPEPQACEHVFLLHLTG